MLENVVISEAGWLEWGGAFGPVPAAAVLAVLALACGLFWWRQLAPLPAGRRASLTGLRIAALALLGFLLFRPTLVRPILEKSTEVVAVLYDDSASMGVRDESGVARSARMASALAEHADDFDLALNSRFHVLDYRFGDRARPLESRAALTFEARETRIVDAVRQVARDTETLAVSAMVVFSDGVQQAPVDPAAMDGLQEAGIPVYTVGIGEAAWRDLALGEVALSRGFFDEAPARITAQFTATGLEGETVVVEVTQGGAVQASEERAIASDRSEQQVQLEVAPRAREWLDFTVRLRFKSPAATGAPREFVAENNEASVLLDHREKEYRVLYFSGRPNWQNKFVRQALAADPELRLSSLIRISGAEKKFVFRGEDTALGNPLFEGFEDESTLPRYDEAVFTRMGLAAGELAEGYPTAPEALYPFHLIIWGDIEADFFAPEHFRVTRDAVAERGASFLMLGGPRALAGGDYSGTLLESMLPVMPGAVERYDGDSGEPGAIAASPEGFLTGVWALNAEAGANALAWQALPELPEVDTITSPRIGASVLAEAARPAPGAADPAASPFLVWHAFGRGKSALMGTGETWPWHMQTEEGNDAHERIWRQLVRSLVSTVPAPVTMEARPGVLVAGSEGTLAWSVRDGLFESVEGATLMARVLDPAGGAMAVPLVERLDAPGTYEAAVTPVLHGKHLVVLEGSKADGEALAPVESALLVRPDTREFDRARFDPALLQDIARETGGRYFPLAKLGEVAGAIAPGSREVAALDRRPIWHHPAFYTALLVLLGAEWTLRRRWGQA